MPRRRRLPIDALTAYLIPTPHPRSPTWREQSRTPMRLDWPKLSGNEHPVEIEVGFGKGMFLTNAGLTRPQVNFLGIEMERPYVLLTAARLAKQRISNVRLACTDARWLLTGVADRVVQAVHVYFPDPWWKKRHQKRKLMTQDFTATVARVLSPGGTLHFATDVKDYFDETCALIEAQGRLTHQMERTAAIGASLTHFERKYQHEGRPIFRGKFVK